MKIFKENSHNLKLLEFTQTHPIPESRIKYLNEYIAKKKSQETAENVEDSGANSKTELSQNKPAENAGTERKAVNLNQNFQGKKIKFSYPKSWTLKKVDAVKKEVKLKYQIEAAELQGGFVLEDLSQKSFMETARKQFIYASIAAEEAGAEVKKNTIEDNKLDIYQLEVIEDDQLRFEYFISQKNEQQLLHFIFELNNKNQAETRNLIRKLLKTIKFL
jgi:predicted Zn-dependent protease